MKEGKERAVAAGAEASGPGVDSYKLPPAYLDALGLLLMMDEE